MISRGGSRTAATSKMEHFVIIFNGWKPLTIITKRSILDAAGVLDPRISVHEDQLAHDCNKALEVNKKEKELLQDS